MPDENRKKSEQDIFIADSIYPEAASIFTYQYKPLEEIKNNCCIVLDTNILLAPYKVGEADLLNQCKKTYGLLIEQNRLIIPAQVVREFAKNRAIKLTEIYQQLSRRRDQIQQIQVGKYPLLSPFEEYEKLVQLEREINTKIQAYRVAINTVLDRVQGWQWDDPVSLLYRDLFTENIVIELSLTKEEIENDLEKRLLHNIPPGFKDATKDDKGVGDLIIWHTILEFAKREGKDVIFVSGDEKADWFHKSEKMPLYPRYELIDEFRRISRGKSFHIIKFSRFLEIFGASEKVLEKVRQEENLEQMTRGLRAYRAEGAVLRWATEKYSGYVTFPSEEAVEVDFKIEDNTGYIRGFIILYIHTGYIFTPNTINNYGRYKVISKLDELFVILVVNEQSIELTGNMLKNYITEYDGVKYLIGFIDDHNRFFDKYYLIT